MNVARSTQLELLLITRTLDIITSTPGISVASFFEDFIVAINEVPESSLSAYWKKVHNDRTSLVEVKASDSGEGVETIVPEISELDYLRSPKHVEIRHDPLLIIRKLYETASSALLSSNNEEKTTLLYSCLVLASKSARVSLLTHTIALLYIFKDESMGIKVKLLKSLAHRAKELLRESEERSEKQKKKRKRSKEQLPIDATKSLVLSFGKADHGKLGLGDALLNRLIPTIVETLIDKSIVKVASMSAYSLALNDSGSVYIWGTGGTVGTMPSSKADITPQLLDALPLKVTIADISCGLGHALFLTNFGRVFAWGNGGNGRLGLGDTIDRTEACVIGTLSEETIVSITCGASHSLALSDKGQLYSWGKNTQGQCGHGSVDDILKPTLMKKLIDKSITVTQVAAGWEHSLALSHEGKMYSWGCGYKDSRRGVIPPVLGLGHSECRTSPELISSIETIKIAAIASGWDHCMALDHEGKLLSWGSGQNGKLGHGNEENISVPCYIPELEDITVIKMAAGCEHSAAISIDGVLYAWGHGDGGRLGIGNNSQSFAPTQVNTLAEMGIIPHFLHCGDKFTIIIGQCESSKGSLSRNLRQSESPSFLTNLSQIQEWVHSTTLSPTLSVSQSPIALTDINRLLQFITEADEDTLCNNEESMMLVLFSMLQAGSSHLLDPLQPSSSISFTDSTQILAELRDQEYYAEICEDTFSNIYYLLEIITPVYLDYLQLFMKSTSTEQEITLPMTRPKLLASSTLDALLLQIYSLLSMNVFILSRYLTLTQETTENQNEDLTTIKESDENASESTRKDGQKNNPLSELNKKLLEDVTLAFAYRKENSPTGNNTNRSTATGVLSNSNANNLNTLHSPPNKQLNSSGRIKGQQGGDSFYSKSKKKGRQRRRGDGIASNPNDTSYDTSLQEQENDYDRDDVDYDDEGGDSGYQSNSDSEPSQLYSARNKSFIRRVDTEEDSSDAMHVTRDNVPSPAPSYESMENSFDEGNRGNGDGYSIASSLQESDDYIEDHQSLPEGETEVREEDVDPDNLELQQALLSSIDSSRRTALRFIQYPVLKTIEQRRGGAYLPKIRNLLNTTSSLTFLCIQQYYEQILLPNNESSPLTAAEIEVLLAKMYATWESTQLVTAGGLNCFYDDQEQKSVLLQIIRSPESFLYIIPGMIRGFTKQEAFFTELIDSLFADSISLFYNEEGNDSPNYLTVDDILRILENLVSLYEKKTQVKSDGAQSNILLQLYDQIQESFAELTARVVFVPIEWFLKLGSDELSLSDSSSSEPWGSKMDLILQLLLSAITYDLEKGVNKLLSAMFGEFKDNNSEERWKEVLNQQSFAKTMIHSIYSFALSSTSKQKNLDPKTSTTQKTASKGRHRQENWKIGTISALLPFTIQLTNHLERIFQEAITSIENFENDRIFSSRNEGKKNPKAILEEWYFSHLPSFNNFFSDLLCYLHKIPKRWLDSSYFLYLSSVKLLNYSDLPVSHLRKYLMDWELIIWSTVPDRLLSFPNPISDSLLSVKIAAASSPSEEDFSAIAHQSLQQFFIQSESGHSLATAWQKRVQALNEESVERRFVKFLFDLYEKMTFSSSHQMNKHPSTTTIVSAATIQAASPEGLRMMGDSYIEGASENGEVNDEESHDDVLEDLNHRKKSIFIFFIRLFYLSTVGDKVEKGNKGYSLQQASLTLMSLVLTFILQEIVQTSVDVGNTRLVTVVHISRLQDALGSVHLDHLPKLLSHGEAEVLLSDKFSEEKSMDLLQRLKEFICGMTKFAFQFDEQQAINSPASTPSTHLLSTWKTINSSNNESGPDFKPVLFLLLLFFDHYSAQIIKTGYQYQSQCYSKQISYLLYSWIMRKWQLPASMRRNFHELNEKAHILNTLCRRNRIFNINFGYSSKMIIIPDSEKWVSTVANLPQYLWTFIKELQEHQTSLQTSQNTRNLLEDMKLSLKKNDLISLMMNLRPYLRIIEQQIDFMKGCSVFAQFSSSSEIAAIRSPLLNWWQDIFRQITVAVKHHPFFFKATDAKDMAKTENIETLFDENLYCCRLVLESLILFEEIVNFPSDASTDAIKSSTQHQQQEIILQQEERRLFSSMTSLVSFLFNNLSFHHSSLLSHFWQLKDIAVQYLLCKRYYLNQSSPLIASNLCSPSGNFTVACWMYFPRCVLKEYLARAAMAPTKKKEDKNQNQQDEEDPDNLEKNDPPNPEDENHIRIHLFSRIPESGDINMIDLITKNPAEIDTYTISANLLINRQTEECVLEVSAVSYVFDRHDQRATSNPSTTTNTAARKKVLHRLTVVTSPLTFDKWINVSIEVVQTVANSNSTAGKSISTDQTFIIVSIDRKIESFDHIASGKWPLHENMVIGKLPHNVGDSVESESSDWNEIFCDAKLITVDPFGLHSMCPDEIKSRSNYIRNSSQQKHHHNSKELQVADFLWAPTTSILAEFSQTSSIPVQPQKTASDVVVPNLADFEAFLSSKKIETQTTAASTSTSAKTQNWLFASFLPSDAAYIVSTLSSSVSTFLEIVMRHYSLPTKSSSLPLYQYKNIIQLFQFFPKAITFGDKAIQRKIFQLYRVCIKRALPPETFSEIFALLEEEKKTSIAFSDDEDEDFNEGDDELNLRDEDVEESVDLESSFHDSKESEGISKRPALSKAVTPVVGSTRNLMQLKHQYQQQQMASSKNTSSMVLLYQKKLVKQVLNGLKWSISFLSSIINPYFFFQMSNAPLNSETSNLMSSVPLTINDDINLFQLPWLSVIPISSTKLTSYQELWRNWCRRLYLLRISVDFITNTLVWTQSFLSIDENAFLRDMSGLFSTYFQQFSQDIPRLLKEILLLNNHTVTASTQTMSLYEKMAVDILLYSCSGGWFPTVNDGSEVVFNPRRVYLTRNHRSHVDDSMFVSEGKARMDESHSSNGIIQILLEQKEGAYEVYDYLDKFTSLQGIAMNESVEGFPIVEIDTNHPSYLPSHPVILPTKEVQFIPITEMTLVKDSSKIQDVKAFTSFFQNPPISSSSNTSSNTQHPSSALLDLFKSILLYSKRNDSNGNNGGLRAQNENKGGANSGASTLQRSLTKGPKSKASTGTSTPADLIYEDEKSNFGSAPSSNHANQLHAVNQLLLMLVSLRSYVVQFTQVPSIDTSNSGNPEDTWSWKTIGSIPVSQIMKDLSTIIAIASLDPVEAAGTIFESSSFKGVQVDVLRNLLREGDINFLEKLSTKLWKQFKAEDQEIFFQHSILSIEAPLQLVALQGEVTISGTKVKALSHFPSVKLLGVGLEKMSGRWFYECILLSDGLMQIGWANSLFRCDPICGQGVGDHVHSWAFDGLRTKKWNVSCDAYGRRWRLGDIVGVLVDMDLMEMKFYLNGEDLGTAFEDFSGYELFPALSLNVRQSVRLNFGQFKFMYPPNLLDGKAFRPVIQAIVDKKGSGNVLGSSVGIGKSGKSTVASTENLGSLAADEQTRMSMIIDDSKPNTENSSPVVGANVNNSSSAAIITGNMTERGGGGNEVRRILMQANNIRSSMAQPLGVSNTTSSDSPNQPAPNRANEQDDKSLIEMPPSEVGDEDGSEHRDTYDSDDDLDRQQTDQDDPRYVLNPRWEEDLEARIRMEVEEGDDYDMEEEQQDDEDEDEDGDDGDDGEQDDREEEEGEEDEENAHMMELRRQAMIESLIGMGFPVDWALRAAEQVDVATSESAAISWIIERMELEQSKMNEMEGDSRGGEGEEYDEAEGIEYFMQRHAAAFAGGGGTGANSQLNSGTTSSSANRAMADASTMITRRLVAEHMAELLENASNLENAMNSSNNMANWSPGSPTREESFGGSAAALMNAVTTNTASGRTLLNPAALGLLMNSDAAYAALITAKINAKKSKNTVDTISNSGGGDNATLKEIEGLELVFTESVPWNDEPSFFPIMPGLYTVTHRHDSEKQEVLTQVNDLDVLDMLPIIATCQFALCIYYARMIVIRLIELFTREMKKQRDLTLALQQPGDLLPSSLSLTKELDQFISLFNVVSMYKFLKNSFRHAILTNFQSDRIFPFMAPATSQGDVFDKVPPFSPFLPYNRIQFIRVLRQLELHYYPQCLGTIAVEDPSTGIINHLQNLILLLSNQAIAYTEEVLKEKERVSETELETNQKENHQRADSKEREDAVNNSSISSSLSGLQDRILQRVGMISPPPSLMNPTNLLGSLPPLTGELCNSFLTTLIENCITNLERAAMTMKFDSFDWIAGSLEKNPQVLYNEQYQHKDESLNAEEESSSTFPQVLFSFWCLKFLLSIALQYKIQENHKFLASNREAASSPTKKRKAENKGDGDNLLPQYMLDENIFTKNSAFYKLTTPEALTRILKISSTQNDSLRYCLYDLAATILSIVNTQLQMTLMKDIQYRFIQSSPLTQITAAEYYVSVAKEKRLLQSFGQRIKLESFDKQLFTRYTRCIGSFLFQWYYLRRQLNLNTFSYMTEFKLSNLSPFHLTELGSDQRSNERDEEDETRDDGRFLRVIQVSTSSVTVAWSLAKTLEELAALQRQISGVEQSEQEDDTPMLYGYNLYITGLSYLGMETPMLVLSNVEYKGQFRVDDLEPDTLYKISIKCDEKKQRMKEKKRRRRKQLRSKFADHQLRGEEEDEYDEEDEEDEDDEEDSEEEEDDERDSLRSPYQPFRSPSDKTLSVVVATESDTTFGFSADSVSSNVVINSSNPLTLRNVANKKWSTARANVRMTSGIHRWDVHIDRCISKNIFVGVATREARLDNYVGCDAYGWAFLANKAVWHGKAKLKNYGELFRTGDTVTVILDLENGTLSYCLNDRPLGVAIDGLVGPLYPAFSLYNEDDQLTIAQVRSTSDHPSFGSFAAENILDRMEAVRSVMQYFSFCHHRTMAEYRIQPFVDQLRDSGRKFERNESSRRVDESGRSTKASSVASPTPSMKVANLNTSAEGKEDLTPTTKKAVQLQQELRQIQKQYSNLSVEDDSPFPTGTSPTELEYDPTSNEVRNNKGESEVEGEESEGDASRLQLLQQYSSKFTIFSEELIHELFLRYQNWISNIGVRTVYAQNNIYCIQMSNELILSFTQKLCQLGDLVIIEKRVARVIGVGACKLWFRAEIDGELIAITQDTFIQMMEKRLIETKSTAEDIVAPSIAISSSIIFDGLCSDYHNITSIVPASAFSFDNKKVQILSDVKPLTLEDMKSLLFQSMNDWSKEDDESLHYLISLFARRMQSPSNNGTEKTDASQRSDYFSFSYLELYYFLFSFREEVVEPTQKTVLISSLPRPMRSLMKFFTQHSLEAMLLRILLFHVLNDLILPLQSFILPYSNSDGFTIENDWLVPQYSTNYPVQTSEVALNHPSAALKSLRSFLYPSTKEQMAISFFYQYSAKMKEMMKAFYSFYSALSYTTLISSASEAPVAPVANSAKRLNPIEKMKYGAHSADQSRNRTIVNSPLTVQSSPAFNYPSHLHTIGPAGMPEAFSNNRVSPTTLYSNTAPTSFFQRGNTETSMNSFISNNVNTISEEITHVNSRQPTKTNLLASAIPATSLNTAASLNSNQSIAPLLDLPLMKDNQFIFYVETTSAFYSYLQQLAREKGSALETGQTTKRREWQLINWLQTSYLGQLLQYFELLQMKFTQETLMHYHPTVTYKALHTISSLSHITPNHPPNSGNNNKDAQNNSMHPNGNKKDGNTNPNNLNNKDSRRDFSLWEYCFRYHYMNFLPASSSSTPRPAPSKKLKALPMVIRCLPQLDQTNQYNVSPDEGTGNERLLIYLQQLEQHPSLISEETVFQVFLQEASDQVQVLIDLLYHHCDGRSGNEEEISIDDLTSCEKEILNQCSVSEISIILHIFHALGVLLGLGLRNGSTPIIRFPALVYSILANEDFEKTSPLFPSALSLLVQSSSTKAGKEKSFSQEYNEYQSQMKTQTSSLKILHSIALVIRFGICSIFPEVLFDLWTKENIRSFLSGNSQLNCSPFPSSSSSSTAVSISVDRLIQLTSYDVSQSNYLDRSIHYFWMSLYELSERQYQLFLQYLYAAAIDEYYQTITNSSQDTVNRPPILQDWKRDLFFSSINSTTAAHRELQRIRIVPKNITLQDLDVSVSASLATTYLSSDDYPITVDAKERTIVLPHYSSLDITVTRMQQLMNVIERSLIGSVFPSK